MYPFEGALAVAGTPFELVDVRQRGGITKMSQHVLDDLLVGTVLEIESLACIGCLVISVNESLEAL